jgi:protein-S-isoprenylcysteine O-methyltransferase Ste14
MAGGAAAIVVFTRFQPQLVQERADRWRDGKAWDKPFLVILGVVGPAAVQLVCGLDKRFGWSSSPGPVVQGLGVVLFAIGTAIVAWAMAVNPFFSAVVRIQEDRGHRVIERGPYAIVRHPGYAGMTLATVGGPLVLATMWGLAPGALVLAAIVVRTGLEDRTLHAELAGYPAYARRVGFRLIPFVW